MRILKFIVGICLFTVGSLFPLAGWGMVLQLLGGILFSSTLITNKEDKKKLTAEDKSNTKSNIQDKEPFKFNFVKIKGILGLIIFIGLLVFLKSGIIIQDMLLEPDSIMHHFSKEERYEIHRLEGTTFALFFSLPLMALSLWLMTDWIKTWFK